MITTLLKILYTVLHLNTNCLLTHPGFVGDGRKNSAPVKDNLAE